MIASAYNKTLEIIASRYSPNLWNIYGFHCSDGDNFDHDNEEAFNAALRLCQLVSLFGYGEIKVTPGNYEGSMIDKFSKLPAKNFKAVQIKSSEDIYPKFRELLEASNEGGD